MSDTDGSQDSILVTTVFLLLLLSSGRRHSIQARARILHPRAAAQYPVFSHTLSLVSTTSWHHPASHKAQDGRGMTKRARLESGLRRGCCRQASASKTLQPHLHRNRTPHLALTPSLHQPFSIEGTCLMPALAPSPHQPFSIEGMCLRPSCASRGPESLCRRRGGSVSEEN
jgi:hypothetical protein